MTKGIKNLSLWLMLGTGLIGPWIMRFINLEVGLAVGIVAVIAGQFYFDSRWPKSPWHQLWVLGAWIGMICVETAYFWLVSRL
ncbi:hypothetical protein [Lactiplantibacillus fabifermentans]|uniref:Uncharacterized protein n=2 Tax=Lactiplantibacillus fabifermentans TaxID=483011 RepID=A0A0R2NP80_9LACO|nr:hypothetical protein [Lactiplantibacillus fabifermentans]ETY73571.1 hypothetical protein LFAB_11720 [Lactiplantibacillus fabifermentans T30PCM01]KRO27461.1 hypothetical protein DY78_GL003209 [Lactiplantibacillus fabifermentans DSM 21115]